MKKKIIILIIIIALADIGVGGYLILRNARTIPEGKYMIKNYAEYPDAYAIVSGKTIQFFNIDFNEMYREQELYYILTAQEERGVLDTGYTKEELIELSDLNRLVVKKPYNFSELNPLDRFENEFSYYLAVEGNLFGVWVHYNTAEKVLKLNGKEEPDPDIAFAR